MDKHIVAITAFVKSADGKRFLVLQRGKHEIAYPGLWAFPGGKAEQGESVQDTLRREVKEETGLEIEETKEYLKDFTFLRKDGHNVIGFCFLVRAKGEKVILDKDFDAYRWVTPAEFASLDHIAGMEEETELAFKK
jgi:8-oxo-dGTP diphosphatase